MSKTPAMALQEHMVRKGGVPAFEFLPRAGNDAPFLCEGHADGARRVGEGRTKKEAKQACCELLLRALGVDAPARPNAADDEARAPPARDRVGRLADLCYEHGVPEPRYEHLEETGPPHRKRFSVRCTLVSIEFVASASTKKLAKHAAAAKMIEHLAERLPELAVAAAPAAASPSACEERARLDEYALAKYAELDAAPRLRLGLAINDYHLAFKRVLNEAQRAAIRSVLDGSDDDLQKVAGVFDVTETPVAWSQPRTKPDADPVSCAYVATANPPICVMGAGETPELAQKEAARKLLEYVDRMMW